MIVAFIQAKGYSERVPNKNLRKLGDKPLFLHALLNARNSKSINKVVIDSDSEEILSLGCEYGATPLYRPSNLTSNSTTGDDLAYWQASQYPESIIMLQIVPTSPFISSETIDRAISYMVSYTSIVGVRKEKFYKWKDYQPMYLRDDKIPNSNELPDTIYETTGLYIIKTKCVLQEKRRICFRTGELFLYPLSKIESIDINTEEDFEFAEIVWNGLEEKSKTK